MPGWFFWGCTAIAVLALVPHTGPLIALLAAANVIAEVRDRVRRQQAKERRNDR